MSVSLVLPDRMKEECPLMPSPTQERSSQVLWVYITGWTGLLNNKNIHTLTARASYRALLGSSSSLSPTSKIGWASSVSLPFPFPALARKAFSSSTPPPSSREGPLCVSGMFSSSLTESDNPCRRRRRTRHQKNVTRAIPMRTRMTAAEPAL